MKKQVSNLQEMIALNEAIKILDTAKMATCREATAIFMKVAHAQDHLNNQLRKHLGE